VLQGLGTELGVANSVVILLIIVALIIYKYGPPWARKKLLPKGPNNPYNSVVGSVTFTQLHTQFEECRKKADERHKECKEDIDNIFLRLGQLERDMAGIRALLDRYLRDR